MLNDGRTDRMTRGAEKTLCRRQKKRRFLEVLKLAAVCTITFFGAAFTIMAFNNDISISGVFAHFYMQVVGTDKPPVTEIEVCYSIGLAVGILLFFNHVGKRRLTSDPTPIEIELIKYEEEVSDTKKKIAGRQKGSE